MAHLANPDREYQLLQKRLDATLTGAPESPTFMKILKLLYSPDEAAVARQIPGLPTPLDKLSRKLNIPEDELGNQLTEMAERGVILDLTRNGRRYFALPPVVIGFFEYTFMRVRDDMPMAELAQLFDQYMHENDLFARSVFAGQSQIGRSLVREEALPDADLLDENHIEILDWERASHVVQSATAVGVSLCACRHKASHLNKVCARPQRTCLTFNYGAESLIRSGIAERITKSEAMSILETSKDMGLAQTADNVQKQVTYICNCCGCCCGMMDAIRTFNINNAIVTSNWLMDVNLSQCNGCGKCVQVCPINAISLAERREGKRRIRWAVRDADLCLGCGTCHGACKFGGIIMTPREKRVFTPETVFDKTVAMAIERGKLSDLIFSNPEKMSHRTLGRIANVIEKSPPVKATMAIGPIKSAFLQTIVTGASAVMGETKAMIVEKDES